MGNYLFAYRGGSMAETQEERDAAMAAWGAWFGQLGGAIVDAGNPFAGSASVGSDGTVSDGAGSGLSGYSVCRPTASPRPPSWPRAARCSPPAAASTCTRPWR